MVGLEPGLGAAVGAMPMRGLTPAAEVGIPTMNMPAIEAAVPAPIVDASKALDSNSIHPGIDSLTVAPVQAEPIAGIEPTVPSLDTATGQPDNQIDSGNFAEQLKANAAPLPDNPIHPDHPEHADHVPKPDSANSPAAGEDPLKVADAKNETTTSANSAPAAEAAPAAGAATPNAEAGNPPVTAEAVPAAVDISTLEGPQYAQAVQQLEKPEQITANLTQNEAAQKKLKDKKNLDDDEKVQLQTLETQHQTLQDESEFRALQQKDKNKPAEFNDSDRARRDELSKQRGENAKQAQELDKNETADKELQSVAEDIANGKGDFQQNLAKMVQLSMQRMTGDETMDVQQATELIKKAFASNEKSGMYDQIKDKITEMFKEEMNLKAMPPTLEAFKKNADALRAEINQLDKSNDEKDKIKATNLRLTLNATINGALNAIKKGERAAANYKRAKLFVDTNLRIKTGFSVIIAWVDVQVEETKAYFKGTAAGMSYSNVV